MLNEDFSILKLTVFEPSIHVSVALTKDNTIMSFLRKQESITSPFYSIPAFAGMKVKNPSV